MSAIEKDSCIEDCVCSGNSLKNEEVSFRGNRQVFFMKGLNCAGCSAKIEAAVAALPEIRAAQMNFSQGKLIVESTVSLEVCRQLIQEISDGIENGVTVVPWRNDTNEKMLFSAWRDELMTHRRDLLAIFVAGFLFGFAQLFVLPEMAQIGLFLTAYFVVGLLVWKTAFNGFRQGDLFNESALMGIATLGAFGIGAWEEAVAVMLFFRVGELVQELAVARSRRSIAQLMDLRPDFARVVSGSEKQEVAPEKVGLGALIEVRPGEKIPLDGIIRQGESQVDTSAISGESVPRTLRIGETIYSGSINLTGVLLVEVIAIYENSTVAKILELVEHASSRKAKMERFVTRFARLYTPMVVFCAMMLTLIPPMFFGWDTFSTWLYRGLLFLVCSCPCALVISIPLSFFGGIGGGSRVSILIKGAQYLEALAEVEAVVFDKTGTLTKGNFRVVDVVPTGGFSQDRFLQIAASLEVGSNHPLAKSITSAWQGEKIDFSQWQEHSGKGISAQGDEGLYRLGNASMMLLAGISAPVVESSGTVVYLACDNEFLGHLIVADELKDGVEEMLQDLRQVGIRYLAMLTGDRISVAQMLAEKLQLDEVRAELLPADKVLAFEAIQKHVKSGKVAFVGDGINDAPVLARADVSIAMGCLGSDAAIASADVVLMNDEPMNIVRGIKIARRTRHIVWQNVLFALGVKGLVLFLGAFGYATMWAAVFADVGVAFLAILNAMRAMKIKNI